VDKKFTIFMVLALVIVVVNQLLFTYLFPPPEPAKPAAKVAKSLPAKTPSGKGPDAAPGQDAPLAKTKPPAEVRADDKSPAVADHAERPADAAPAVPIVGPQRGTLGSLNTGSPFRMLISWSNRGAVVERVELNSPGYRDLEQRSGYLGYLAPADAPHKAGALVRVVGAGTPAAAAGIRVDDVVTDLGKQKIATAADLVTALAESQPGDDMDVMVLRQGAPKKLSAKLTRHPLALIVAEDRGSPIEVIEAHNHDPLSFLFTISQYDERVVGDSDSELGGVELFSSEWEVATANESTVRFKKTIPKLGLEVTKSYTLDVVPPEQLANTQYPAYSLMLDVSVKNVGDTAHTVAYRLAGPTGLPIEGAWYASKIGRNWGGTGLRDIIARFRGGSPTQISSVQLSDPEFRQTWKHSPLDYIAVDAQYFAAAMIPQKADPTDEWFSEVKPLRAGEPNQDKRMTNVTFQMDSVPKELSPADASLAHQYQVFLGPKRPPLLDRYGPAGTTVTLDDLVYYGWFTFVARPLLAVLHVFHRVVGNYGLAIVMLTVLVRGLMFPLSRRQAASQAKMAELQPEIKKLNEKYKNDPAKRTQAQQQLFREHDYNPLGGCLLALIQLPIFVGLYSSLRGDVELRQAPLISENVRWASDLAAPDMLWNWSGVVPEFVSHGTGVLGLGPYFNLLPLATIALFIWQQKMFMPPPADEQAAMQQKMMQYMMIVVAIMFFKVPAGLGVYLITSSLWGIAERKLLGKSYATGAGASATAAVATSSSGNGAAGGRRRQKGRK
jgi:YidC/Oxa1 family membrane protein insertase